MNSRCIYREQHDDTRLEIWEEDDKRSLWFDDAVMQSEIHVQDPSVLPNPVNRMMLAHLMFELPLQQVLLGGCGGGAIARWFHARMPEARGVAVELSETVARLAREYFDFPPAGQSRWLLVIDDIRAFVSRCSAQYDFILVDLEENQASPDWLTGTEFISACRDCLSDHGVLTLNLIVDSEAATCKALQRTRQVFGPNILLLGEPAHDNLIALAFRGDALPVPERETLVALGRRWGIDFTSLAARIRRLPDI